MQFLTESLVELITQTSTNLPPDVREAMGMSIASETPGTQSAQALSIIAANIDMAQEDVGPICQDTGMPTFVVHTPVGVNQIKIRKAIREAVAEATRRGKLRPNSVDSMTGKNSGDNLGHETPVIHFDQWEQDEIEVKLILKGGGCENKNIQYSLPCNLDHMGRADRTLEGVRKCLLHAVWQAQGQGCAPGALGVCIGSDRGHGYVLAKQELVLPIAGGIFVIEAGSVILQRYYYKATHRRIFRMAPLHHHFELGGWPETQVVVRFWIISIICGLVALSTLKLR